MSKQILIETPVIYKPDVKKIEEGIKSSVNEGNIILDNVLLLTAEEKNGNGRYYPKELWKREIARFQELIENQTTQTCGELDHPDSQLINLKNASHCFRKVWWDGDQVRALIEVFSSTGPKGNESGRILGSFLRNGLSIGFSTRGMGSLKQVGEVLEVQDDFEFLTADAVSNPSNKGSWAKINESKNSSILNPYNKINGIITDILCSNGTCPIW